MTPILAVISEIHEIVGRALVNFEVISGVEAWVNFVDHWERREFYSMRQTVSVYGKMFLMFDSHLEGERAESDVGDVDVGYAAVLCRHLPSQLRLLPRSRVGPEVVSHSPRSLNLFRACTQIWQGTLVAATALRRPQAPQNRSRLLLSEFCVGFPQPSDGGAGGRKRGSTVGWSVRMGGSDNKGDGLASQPRRYRVPGQPLLNRHQVGGVSRSPDGLFAQQEREPIRSRPTVRGKRTYGGRPGQRAEEQGTWAAQKHSEAGYGRPVDRGVWTAKTVKRPRQQTAHHATFSTVPTHQLLGSANTETTPAGAPAAAADRTQRPDATCEGKNG